MQPPYYSLIDMIDLTSTVSRRNETGYVQQSTPKLRNPRSSMPRTE